MREAGGTTCLWPGATKRRLYHVVRYPVPGISLLRRQGEHFRDPLLKDYKFEPIYRTDVYSEQRGLEQLLHEQYGPPLNKINPISPTNPNRQLYLDAAEQYLNQGAGR